MIPRWLVIVVAMLASSGCATTWSRPATSSAEFNLDSRACQHMNARLVFLSSGLVGEYIVPSGYQRCMLEEGYAEGGSWTGSSGWRDEGARTPQGYRVGRRGSDSGAEGP